MIRLLLRVLGHDYAKPLQRTVLLMAVTAIAEGLSYALLVPVLTALLGPTPTAAWPWLIGFAAAVAGYAVLRYACDVQGFRVGTTLLRGVYHRLGNQLARLPLGWFTPDRVGSVSLLASKGVLQAMSVIAHLLAPFISAILTPLTVVLIMIAFNPTMGLVALLAAPLVAAVQIWTSRTTAAADTERHERDREASARVIEYLQAQPVLRTGGRTGERFEELDDSLHDLQRTARRHILASLPSMLGLTFIVQAFFTVLLVLGAHLALSGLGSSGFTPAAAGAEILAILVLAARCADPLLSLAEMGGSLRSARSELARLDDLLTTDTLPEPQHPTTPTGREVTFRRVTFRQPGRTVTNDLSLSVPEGQRLAVVGPSGSGKTTILQLLARFHDIDAGAVLIGGVDVREINTETLMGLLAIVFQDVYLFDGSIEENIRLGRPDAADDDVRAAASAAQLDEVIERLPDGWASHVGEGGSLLSGGERQRVSIARALLKDAPIVLLDEVTSALDPVNEAAVHAGIQRLMAGRTVLMVAHRMATVRHADRIVFLDDGAVVEEGTHDELISQAGRYAEFWRLDVAEAHDHQRLIGQTTSVR